MFVERFCRDICRPPVLFCRFPPTPPPLVPQPIPLTPTATMYLNPSLSSRYQNVNTACFALLFSCSVQETNMEERGSYLDIDGFRALQSR